MIDIDFEHNIHQKWLLPKRLKYSRTGRIYDILSFMYLIIQSLEQCERKE